MEWSLLQDNLSLSQVVGSKLKAILTDLQQQFFELCAYTVRNTDKSIIEKLSEYLSNENAEPQLISQYLISLLQDEEINGRSKFELLLEIEQNVQER